jgi:glycerol-1-phosphate dehydrogenase [NAD(P)+]
VHERALEAEVARVPAAATVVAGIGGGVACDAAKYIAWRCGLRFVCIPTAVTVDAFVTPPAGVRFDAPQAQAQAAASGAPQAQAAASAITSAPAPPDDISSVSPLSTEVRYVGHASPNPLVTDWDLIRTAPAALNVAGVGDILSIHTACWDWEEAVRAGKSEFPASQEDIAAARAVLADTLAAAHEIAACSDAGLAALVEGYMRVNALCLPAGHARVEEGSEHYLFYALEARLGRGFVHGHIVGLGVAIMAALQGNGAAEITAAMSAMGLHFQPVHMGISRADLRAALLGLQAFVDRRSDLWHTVISQRHISDAWVDSVLDGLDFGEPVTAS